MNTGAGSRPLLQGIFPTQESNQGLLHCRWILYPLSHQGSSWLRHSGLNVLTAYFFLTFVLFIHLHNFAALSLPIPASSHLPPSSILRLIFTSVLLLHLLGITFLFNSAEISIKTVLFFFLIWLYRLWVIKKPRSIFPISLINFGAWFSKMFDFFQKYIHVRSTRKAHFHVYQSDNYT